jgi:hypothetical protein
MSIAILTVSVAEGCDYTEGAQGIPPDVIPPPSVVVDTVQWASEPRPGSLLATGNFPILSDAVPATFLSFASIDFSWVHTSDTLPPPNSSNYVSPNTPDWPDPDLSGSVYYNYAAAFRDTHYPYAIFYVNHFHGNDTTNVTYCQPGLAVVLWGVSTGSATPNTVDPNRSRRFSFVFLSDMQALVLDTCHKGQEAVEYALIHITTHEYGHQRAGLTDYDSVYSSQDVVYHQGLLPNGRDDVMKVPMSDAELYTYPFPVFDQYRADTACQHNTCKGNLKCNRTVH